MLWASSVIGYLQLTKWLILRDELHMLSSGNENEFHFFEGSIKGKIVFPRGKNGFGWDRIFQPSGHNKTFAEMTKEEKFKISMRTVAVNKLKNFLSK